MQQYNMGIDTLVREEARRDGLLEQLINLENVPELQYAKEHNLAMAANGAMFSKEHLSIIVEEVIELYAERKATQKKLKEAKRAYEDNPTDELATTILILDAIQIAIKIAINSLYGASGNEGFRYFNHSIAEGITQSGQLAIKYIGKRVCEFLDKLCDTTTDVAQWWSYSDTDSVVGDSIIIVDGQEMPISKLFDDTTGAGSITRNGSEVKQVSGRVARAFDGSNVVDKPITYVMRHKTNKRLYRISDGSNQSVIVTEDHSVIVKRDGECVSCKPHNILVSSDSIILHDGCTATPTIEYIGYTNDYIYEYIDANEYVYDIEVEDTHNFFANGILVHNSMYISLDYLVQKLTHGKPFEEKAMVDLIDKITKEKIEPFIEECLEELAAHMNAYTNSMVMKREVIADAMIFRAKKKYIASILDNEGIRYHEPHLKTMGVETATSTTPQFVKDALLKCYAIMLRGKEEELIEFISQFKQQFKQVPYEEIATPRGVNNLGKWIESDGSYKLRIPFHIKASHEYNRLLNEHGLIDMTPITDASKIRLLLLKPNAIVDGGYIAYNSFLPKEFGLHDLIDYDTMLEKTFIDPIKSFSDLLGWNTEKVNTLSSFFD